MKRAVVLGLVFSLTAVAVGLGAPLETRWGWWDRLPWTRWDQAAVASCTGSSPALLRRAAASRVAVDCPASWWRVEVDADVRAPLAAWLSRAAADEGLPPTTRVGLGTAARGLGAPVHAGVAWLAAARSDSDLGAALLGQIREDHLDPATADVVAARAWVEGVAEPDRPGVLARRAGLGWLAVPGLIPLAAERAGLLEPLAGPGDRDGAPAACADPEARACALEAADRLPASPTPTGPLPEGVAAWSAQAGLDADAVATWVADWSSMGAPAVAAVARERLRAAGHGRGADPFAWHGERSQGAWTSALGAWWVASAAGVVVHVARRGDAPALTLDGVEVVVACGPGSGPVEEVSPRALLAFAAWEHARFVEDAGRWRGFALRLLGAPALDVPGAAGAVVGDLRRGPTTPAPRWPDCGAPP